MTTSLLRASNDAQQLPISQAPLAPEKKQILYWQHTALVLTWTLAGAGIGAAAGAILGLGVGAIPGSLIGAAIGFGVGTAIALGTIVNKFATNYFKNNNSGNQSQPPNFAPQAEAIQARRFEAAPELHHLLQAAQQHIPQPPNDTQSVQATEQQANVNNPPPQAQAPEFKTVRIQVNFNAGEARNRLAIRGKGATGLSWDQNVHLKKAQDMENTWISDLEVPIENTDDLEFKIVHFNYSNDEYLTTRWESCNNHKISVNKEPGSEQLQFDGTNIQKDGNAWKIVLTPSL